MWSGILVRNQFQNVHYDPVSPLCLTHWFSEEYCRRTTQKIHAERSSFITLYPHEAVDVGRQCCITALNAAETCRDASVLRAGGTVVKLLIVQTC